MCRILWMLVAWLVAIAAVVPQEVLTDAFTLITFDVDGTLVKGSGQAADTSAHSRAFSHAVGAVLSNDNRSPVTPVAQALPRHLYHGSTDGLILLRLAQATLDIETDESFPKLNAMMNAMYNYIADLPDDEVARGITPLPGVIDVLNQLSTKKDSVMCGLVTGNVEGIARRKMRAVGIWQTGALHAVVTSPGQQQLKQRSWSGSDDLAFLGGFGSDYCSGDIVDLSRNYLDRARQIEIAVQRCQAILQTKGATAPVLQRVVHVGDAPADVLAAKSYAKSIVEQREACNSDLELYPNNVLMIATATGSYSAQELRDLAGDNTDAWECVVLEHGMADPRFVEIACGGS